MGEIFKRIGLPIIGFVIILFVIIFLLLNSREIEECPKIEPRVTYNVDLPIGGVAKLLVHDEHYNEYLEESLRYLADNIIYEKPIEEWVDRHLKMVGKHRLYMRVSPNKDDDHNIYGILNPYEEIMVIGTYGDWYMIDYEDEILYVMAEYVSDIEYSNYDGTKLSPYRGRIQGPNGSETYYNLDMSRIVAGLQNRGYEGEYWIREDGCKMYGKYIMVAANYKLHPYGSIVETSLGLAIVCDTGGFVEWNPTGLDLATNW